jgi:hypothetical protein
MSVYAGIDVHRKRSQVAVTGAKGKVIANRNVPNGVGPILKVIGGWAPRRRSRPRSAPAGWWSCWRTTGSPAPGAPVAVQGDRLGQAEK